METVNILMIVTIGTIFNFATVLLLRVALKGVDLKEAMSEKSASMTGPAGTPVDTSYSRVAGMIGAIILATFIWGVGNVVLYRAITDPASVEAMLKGISSFIIAAASLFLPYAANQVREAFAKNPPKS